MKPEIHPKLNAVVFVDTSCGAEFVTTSTLQSEETRMIDGVSHYVINIEVSSASHPFYTGKQRLVDTTGMVDKFMARQQAAKKKQSDLVTTQKNKAAKNQETIEEKITRKALEKEEEKAQKEVEKESKKKQAAKKKADAVIVKKAPVKKTPAKKKSA